MIPQEILAQQDWNEIIELQKQNKHQNFEQIIDSIFTSAIERITEQLLITKKCI